MMMMIMMIVEHIIIIIIIIIIITDVICTDWSSRERGEYSAINIISRNAGKGGGVLARALESRRYEHFVTMV
jgi:hypothetical protein